MTTKELTEELVGHSKDFEREAVYELNYVRSAINKTDWSKAQAHLGIAQVYAALALAQALKLRT